MCELTTQQCQTCMLLTTHLDVSHVGGHTNTHIVRKKGRQADTTLVHLTACLHVVALLLTWQGREGRYSVTLLYITQSCLVVQTWFICLSGWISNVLVKLFIQMWLTDAVFSGIYSESSTEWLVKWPSERFLPSSNNVWSVCLIACVCVCVLYFVCVLLVSTISACQSHHLQ